MWFLPTRARPDACDKLIAAMEKAGDCPEVAVMIDDDPARYANVLWPAHWHLHVAPEHMEMTAAVNGLVALYPGRSFYGFFGDHFRPLTPWSRPLQDAAGDWGIAWPNDRWISKVQVSAAPCFGGKLVKELGWICLPTTLHLCTDNVWLLLWKHLGIGTHVESVLVDHDRPERGGRARDENHKRIYHGQEFNAADFSAWKKWRDEDGIATTERIRDAMKADGYVFDRVGNLKKSA